MCELEEKSNVQILHKLLIIRFSEVFSDLLLDEESTIRNFWIVQVEGNRKFNRDRNVMENQVQTLLSF